MLTKQNNGVVLHKSKRNNNTNIIGDMYTNTHRHTQQVHTCMCIAKQNLVIFKFHCRIIGTVINSIY